MVKIKGSFAADQISLMSKTLIELVLPRQPLFRSGRYGTVNGAASGEQSWSDVSFLDEPCCVRCGFPFAYDEGPESLCGRCAVKPLNVNQLRAAFAYNDASRGLVLRFKHGGETEGLAMFARQMQRAGRHMLKDADVLVPVPLHMTRLIKRRYNQSALLARALSARCGTRVETNALLRARKTDSQGGKTAEGRRRNVQGAFNTSQKFDFKDKHVVLIDDVMTTGATLDACARCLITAGARRVDGLVLSRVVKAAQAPT